MGIQLPCCSSQENSSDERKDIYLEDADYEVEEKYEVASFNPKLVRCEYLQIFNTAEAGNRSLLISAFHRKTFHSAILGVTWKPVLVFLFLYFCFQIPYQLGGMSTCSRVDNSTEERKTESAEEAAVCNRVWHDWITGMKENESTATRYLTFILGFYVGQMIKRWWDQLKSLPDIDPITNCLAGFVQLEFKDGEEAKDLALHLRKMIVRYCLLSWTMCLVQLSPPLKEKFESDKPGEKYIDKRLITTRELKALQGNRPSSWQDQWWIPLTWAISLVNANHPDSQGCKIKDQKDFISQLNRFQSNLHNVSLYQNNPLPLIYGQALMVAIYSWILLGVFSEQYLDIQHSASVIFFSLPLFQIVKIILIYAWMKVANIVRNPFGGTDHNYDIDLEEMLDQNIWKASVSIKHMDNPIYI